MNQSEKNARKIDIALEMLAENYEDCENFRQITDLLRSVSQDLSREADPVCHLKGSQAFPFSRLKMVYNIHSERCGFEVEITGVGRVSITSPSHDEATELRNCVIKKWREWLTKAS